jgi:hypothetical protein
MKTATNKRLLISESHGDLNRCTLCRGKPDQHITRFSRSVRIWPSTIHVSRGPRIATLHVVNNRVEQGHCFWEKGLPTQSTVRRLTDPQVSTQFLPEPTNEVVGAKPTFCGWSTTRLIGPISPACDRYIQYLLMGGNPSVLNQHRRGL